MVAPVLLRCRCFPIGLHPPLTKTDQPVFLGGRTRFKTNVTDSRVTTETYSATPDRVRISSIFQQAALVFVTEVKTLNLSKSFELKFARLNL